MSQLLTPARVSSPGRILKRELEARGWTQKALAEIMGRPHQTINGIINGNKQITPETAIELAEALGTSAELWTNLESKYRLHNAKKESEHSLGNNEIARKGWLYGFAPVAEMIKRGWIAGSDSVDELEVQVCRFFEIAHVRETPQLAVSCRQAADRDPQTSAQMAWVRRVEIAAREQTVLPFDRERLQAAIPEILSYSLAPEGVELVAEKLCSLGVHFVILPQLSKTFLDGAAFYLDGHPVIALTLRYDRIDNFWFTLMHEVGHVVAGHKGSYLDDMDNLEVNEEEVEANQLAACWLLKEQELTYFIEKTKPYFSEKKVVNFAMLQQRHPGIVVGRLQRSGDLPYKNLSKLKVKVKRYLSEQIYQ